MPWMQHKPGNGIIYAADGEIQGNFIYGRGVPQGGILSPWLFNLVIDELLNSLEINQFSVDILAFADDICVGGSSAVKIQETVNFIEEWLESSGMELAKNKCEYLYSTNLLIDGVKPTSGSYMSDISTVLNEFEIDIVDALTCREPQAKESRSKIRDHVALTRQKDVKAKLKIHEWRTERQPPVSATMSPLFNSPFSVSLFHFRLPSFEFGCIKGKEVKNDPRDDCPFCGAKILIMAHTCFLVTVSQRI
eukprot:GHVP01032524.1.p1 GENE.GHVP01032524.1~~GHVP01032524.1.p1  ORF type:complete len:249 (+),score=33.13 GHVP01032524.1:274-1020(+)